MWKAFQHGDKHKKHQKHENHWYPTKIVIFVDVIMSKTYYVVWKRYKTDLKCS